ncbi:MAG: hypothetical protein M5U26_04695 [Planctomycetota bacterium]|nr:hypothetical protein [Planctomycetota bacterium]
MRNAPPFSRALAAGLALLVCAGLHARDKDKERLFNTFYADGDKVTWVLVLNQDRTYRVIGPDGKALDGKLVASNDEMALTQADGRRHFSFKFDGDSVWLTPSKKDEPNLAGLLGRVPPTGRNERFLYVDEETWVAKGRAKLAAAGPPVQPDAPAPGPAAPNPAVPQPAVPAPEKVDGHYRRVQGQQTWELKLAANGTFEYLAANGQKANGTYLYVAGELTMDSGFHRRHLAIREADSGIQFWRREVDILKLGDPLGEMPPQDRDPDVWTRLGAAPPREAAPQEPLRPQPISPTLPEPPGP